MIFILSYIFFFLLVYLYLCFLEVHNLKAIIESLVGIFLCCFNYSMLIFARMYYRCDIGIQGCKDKPVIYCGRRRLLIYEGLNPKINTYRSWISSTMVFIASLPRKESQKAIVKRRLRNVNNCRPHSHSCLLPNYKFPWKTNKAKRKKTFLQ